MPIEDTREAAIRRIHEDERERTLLELGSDVLLYEAEKANVRYFIRQLCGKYGACLIRDMVTEAAESLGQEL